MPSSKPKLEQVEIEGVDALFGNIASPESQPVTLVDISQIIRPANQPRRYFDEAALHRLANSVKEKGILQPLLVRPLNGGKYELIAGERRYKAAIIAELKEVPVLTQELSDTEAYELALMENLQREDLNPVEETEGILELLSRKMGKQRDEIISLFHKSAHPQRKTVNTGIHKNELEMIERIFTVVGRITPESFRTNRLPLLNLPTYLLEALKQGQIEYSKARVIGRVKEPKKAQKLLTEAIKENLSRKEIEERVRQLNHKKHRSSRLEKHLDSTITQVKKAKLWEQPEKKKRLEEILRELDQLLKS